jgi:hypothetical protein
MDTTRAEPLSSSDGTLLYWVGVNLDIDDAMRAEETLTAVRERLALASQVATGAQLSAPIAHKMVQPLSALVANPRAALHWLEGRSQRHPPRRISYRDRPARWHVDRECSARDGRGNHSTGRLFSPTTSSVKSCSS